MSTILPPAVQGDQKFIKVWWFIWAALLIWLGFIYFFLVQGKPLPVNVPPEKSLTGLVGLLPLFVSIIIRWLVLPRYHDLRRAFPMFIAGLALAEACGIMGIFLGGPYRDDLFLLGVLGIAQYVPFFAKGYLEPKSEGFIPSN